MFELGSFSVPNQSAPFCSCKKEQLLQLNGKIPKNLNRRTIGQVRLEDSSFSVHQLCSCGKVHCFKVTANPVNFVITETPLE